MRYGIIGCGRIHRNHAQAARLVDGVELVGVADLDDDARESAAKEWNVPGYSDHTELVAAGVDAVGLCLPHHLHAPVGIELAEAGVHVLTEKPLAVNVDEADALIEACARNGVQLAVAFQNRFNANAELVRDRLTSGALGRPVLGTASFEYHKSPDDTAYFVGSDWRGTWARDGGGVINAHAVHAVDLLCWLLGEVDAARGELATLTLGTEVEDTAVGMLRFATGALGSVAATMSVGSDFVFQVTISGTNGRAVITDSRRVEIDFHDGRREVHDFSYRLDAPGYETRLPYGRGHIGLIADFAAAIRDQRPPRCSGVDARHTLHVVKSLYRDAGAPIEL